jgi:hypothetical protein
MGAAVLEEADVLLVPKDIFVGGGVEDLPSKESVLEGVVRRLRLKGHDAEYVIEDDGDLDISKYLGEESLRYLDAMELDEKQNAYAVRQI